MDVSKQTLDIERYELSMSLVMLLNFLCCLRFGKVFLVKCEILLVPTGMNRGF